MDATPFNFGASSPVDDALASGDVRLADDSLSRRWTALHKAAGVIATLAGEAPGPAADVLAFPDRMRRAPHWRRTLAEQGIEDLAAIMEPGLSALIAVHSHGRDAAAPARALWHEFTAARDALVRLAAPHD